MVQGMDEKHKVLIELIYFKGYTQNEASQETGMPLGTVKTRVRQAILSLREIFGDSRQNPRNDVPSDSDDIPGQHASAPSGH